MDEDAQARAFGTALRQQSGRVVYADYKVKNDFTVWLKGFREKIRMTFHYTAAQDAEVDAEVVRSISGKLESGPALDAYERLDAATKLDYELLVSKLTEEYLDPQERRKFIENFSYNKRKKNQSIKEFRQEIIKDMNRYSGAPEGRTKEKEAVRRFKNGMRDEKGKKSGSLKTHMKFHLHNDDDLTWAKAVDAASRWEASNSKADESESSSSSSSEEEVKIEAMKEKARRKAKRKGKTILATVGEDDEVATLADQVKANTMDVKGVKTELERTNTELKNFKGETNTNFSSLFQEMKSEFARDRETREQEKRQPQQQQQSQQQSQPKFSFRNFNQNQNQRQGSNIRPQQQQSFQQGRPQNYTWKGRFNQTQQTGFGLKKSSPTTFPKPTASNAATAAVEEEETVAENLNDNGETVTMSAEDFRKLTLQASYDVEEDEVVAACEEINF